MLLADSLAPPFILPAVILVGAAAAIAYICFRLGLVPIVGFLVAGVIIGPHALGLVDDLEVVNSAAEVGVILLLFTIGIEFSLGRLARIKTLIFAGGGLQVLLAILATAGLLHLFSVSWRAGLFTGCLVSLSSTAIVLKLLADRGETSAPYGQVSLALLIFQDLAIIVMVLLVPVLAGTGGSTSGIGLALLKAAAIVLVVLVFARRLMPPILERVARSCSPELFLLTVIAICFGTAWLTSVAGVSLSLGAFLAGLLVSESRFSHHAFGEIMPLQILFSAVFFVSVGMLLDVSFLVQHSGLVLAAVALVLAVKVVTTATSVRALRYPSPVAAAVGLTLAQIGEFSFVLDRAGHAVGLSPAGLGESGSQAFIAASVMLMVGTPQLTALGSSLAARLERRQRTREEAPPDDSGDVERFAHFSQHVIVAGYGQAARQLTRIMRGSKIPFVITTLSPGGANDAEAAGMAVLRGDYARSFTLLAAGVDRAKMVVVADDDLPMAHRVIAVTRSLAPTASILARTKYQSDADSLHEAGTDVVVVEEREGIVQLFAEVMRTYRLAPEEIERHEATIRNDGYAALEAEADAVGSSPIVCSVDQQCLDTRVVTVRDGAAVAGRTLQEIDLEGACGLAVQGVARRQAALPLEPGLRLAAGDRLTLAGTAQAFAAAAALFRTGPPVTDDEPAIAPSGRADIDPHDTVTLEASSAACSHLSQIRAVHPSARGCQECLAMGDTWVHLRICMTCGHVGCCDTSKNKHATAHFYATSHPIIKSLERGEQWGWCYTDGVTL